MADEKLKILHLRKLLLEETDSDHPLNAAQISDRLEHDYGYSCNRKTVYADVERLKAFGMKIEQKRGLIRGYYVSERHYELPELKLLVDAVQSSKFITNKRSEELIKKLGCETSRENARLLQRDVFIYNRAKTENSSIYENVDVIHSALHDNMQIGFKYCYWTVQKKLLQKKEGAEYVVSPWALTWDDENYYLVGFDADNQMIKHYRVDKIQEIRIIGKARLGREFFEKFDLAAYSRKTFGMYGGRDVRITLEADKGLAGVIIDRFGTDIILVPHKKDRFRTVVTVAVSPQFFGWIAGIGKGIEIASPKDVREEYKRYLQDILENYLKESDTGA